MPLLLLQIWDAAMSENDVFFLSTITLFFPGIENRIIVRDNEMWGRK